MKMIKNMPNTLRNGATLLINAYFLEFNHPNHYYYYFTFKQ